MTAATISPGDGTADELPDPQKEGRDARRLNTARL
jgi:hypothetical protein